MTARTAAACLHAAVALFLIVTVGLLWGAAASLTSLVGGTLFPGLLQMFGTPLALAAVGVAGLQLVAAVALMLGQRWARFVVAGYSVLLLFVVPFGTAVGGFTLWALFRPRPPETFLINAPR